MMHQNDGLQKGRAPGIILGSYRLFSGIESIMKMRASRVAALLGLVCAAAGTASAGKYVVVLHNAAGWQLHSAEKISINGKIKIRRAPDAKPEIAAEVYQRLTPEMLGAAPLRVHRGGYLVVRSGQAWNPVFPAVSVSRDPPRPRASGVRPWSCTRRIKILKPSFPARGYFRHCRG